MVELFVVGLLVLLAPLILAAIILAVCFFHFKAELLGPHLAAQNSGRGDFTFVRRSFCSSGSPSYWSPQRGRLSGSALLLLAVHSGWPDHLGLRTLKIRHEPLVYASRMTAKR